MTADDESAERSQRTVAELLAQYGESAPATGRRRSRRRTDDAGAQPAADPSTSDHGASGPNGEQAAPDPPATGPSTSPPTDLFEAGVPDAVPGGARPPAAGAPPPIQQQPPQVPAQGAPYGGIPGHARPPRREPPLAYPPGQDPVATAETAPWFQNQPEPPTEQLPRYAPDGQVHTNGRAAPGEPPTGRTVPADYAAAAGIGAPDGRYDEPGEPTGAGIALDDLDPREAVALGPADETESADAPPTKVSRADREPVDMSPTTAWLAMVAQWIGGAIGGAALWVAFRYLWTAMPVVALVAAVLVIGGLVLLVRAIRRSDDLKTTVFAVLVGLVVTVSPAVLVLVTR